MSAFHPDSDFENVDLGDHGLDPRQGEKANGQAGAAPEDKPDPNAFRPISFPALAGMEPPPRQFVLRDWLPAGCVTGLWGEGGIGKSMLSQQLATCASTGISAFGFEVDNFGTVLGVFSEDEHDELWRRQVRINRSIGAGMRDLRSLHLQGRAGLENALVAYPTNKPPVPQPLLHEIVEACERYHPVLVILDNVAQLFAGNENDRFQVSHFCNIVGGLAVRFRCAVLLLGHPSKTLGSEYSGSTAWNAAVRSRMFLARDGDGELRLTCPKANYTANGGAGLQLSWVDGVLRSETDALGPLEESFKRDAERHVEEAFLDALDKLTGLGEVVAFSPQARNHAPRVMVKMRLVGDLRETALRDAMVRLVESGELETDAPVKQRAGRRWAYGLARKRAEGERRPDEEEAPLQEGEAP